MSGFFSILLNVSTIVFAVSSMFSVGLANTLKRILGPLRDVGAVTRAVVANFVLVPLLAYLVVQLIPLAGPHAVGLFVIGTAAGAPFLIKLVEVAESDVPLSASLLVLLLPVTIVYMPIVIPWVLPDAELSAGAIARPLLLTMLLPLAFGIVVRGNREELARRIQPWMRKLSTLALVLLLISTVVVNFDEIRGLFGLETILATVILIGGAFGIGFLLGGPDRESREVLGLGTGQRNMGAAIVVATQTIRIPETTSMIVFASLVGLAILFGLTAVLRHSGEEKGHTGAQRPSPA